MFRLIPICVCSLILFAGCGPTNKSESNDEKVTPNRTAKNDSVTPNEQPTDPGNGNTTPNEKEPQPNPSNQPNNAPPNNAPPKNVPEPPVVNKSDNSQPDKVAPSQSSDKEKQPAPETKAESNLLPPSNSQPNATVNGNSKTNQLVKPANKLQELEAKIQAFQVPPDWLAEVKPKWDINKPWKEARLEIRRLLGENKESSRREGIRLTWDYLQKDDIGDKHEYGMYMFLGSEPIWAIIAYREYVNRKDLKYPPYHGVHSLASLYAQYGAFEEAEKILNRGLEYRPPDAKWNEMRLAEVHDWFGDLYVAWDKPEKARKHYAEAMRLFPLAKPPYGRHLLPRRAKKVQSKLDLMSLVSLEGVGLKDGTYRDTALGYSGDVKLTIRVEQGKISKIDIDHKEKIEQNATKIIPQRIIDEQTLKVDGVSGATVTKDAIIGGTIRALRGAGLN